MRRRPFVEPMHEGRKNEILTLAEKYKTLTISKHLILAKGDPLCYQHIKKLSEENPEVPAHYIANCGHYIPIDRPEELNAILESILFPAS